MRFPIMAMGASLLAALLEGGCSSATYVTLEISNADGSQAPEALSINVYDARSLRHSFLVNGQIPGTFVVNDKSRGTDKLRIVARTVDADPRRSASATVETKVGSGTRVPLVLSASFMDLDGDGVDDPIDNCPIISNGDQADADGDGTGDACTTITPTLALRFIEGPLDPSVSFVRASLGTYFDSDGVLRLAAADAPRFQHDPVTGEPLGLLIEPARQNLLPVDSADFGSKAINVTVTQDIATAPDGTNHFDRFTTNAVSAAHYLYYSPISGSSATMNYSVSVFMKYEGHPSFQLWLANDATSTDGVTGCFNLMTKSETTAAHGSGTVILPIQITDVGNGVSLVTMTGSPGASTGSGDLHVALLFMTTDCSGQSFNQSGLSVLAWGLQIESGSYATSYIPTTAAGPAGRQGDLVSVPVTATPLSTGASATFVAQWFAPLATTTMTRRIFHLRDDDDGNSIDYAIASGVSTSRFSVTTSGNLQIAAGANLIPWTANAHHLAVAGYDVNGASLTEDQVPSDAHATIITPRGLTSLDLGTDLKVMGDKLTGTLKQLYVYAGGFTPDQVAFASTMFAIAGVTGGNDTIVDDKLTDGTIPTIHWQDTTAESGYTLTILASDKSTVVCSAQQAPADATKVELADCNLASGTYWVDVVAQRDDGLRSEATNSPFRLLRP